VTQILKASTLNVSETILDGHMVTTEHK